MPWSLSEGKIVADPEGMSWTEAVKHQRAFLANQSRLASMYAELDALEETPEELVEQATTPELKAAASELVRIEIGKENEALTASLMERMEQMSQREAETQMALVAALHAIGTRESVVNVAAPPPANVTVEAAQPAEVQVDVHVPEQAAPNVTVNPEIFLPENEVKRKVTFVRDPFGKLEAAEITEE